MPRSNRRPEVAVRAVAETRRKIKAKVDVLEKWAKSGRIPEGEVPPKSMEAFRKWTDDDLGLEAIGSMSTLGKPAYRQLRQKAEKLLPVVQRLHADTRVRKQTKKTQVEALTAERRDLMAEIQCLANELTEQREIATQSKANVERLEQQVEDLALDRANLIQQLSEFKLIPRIVPHG